MTSNPKRTKKPTVHNPTNFEPSDYTVIGYIDNQPPYVPPSIPWDSDAAEFYREERKRWAAEFDHLFPKGNAFKCEHCGQGNVRYVVSALHVPTGEHTCFGDICCDRLELPNHEAFRAKLIRSKAAAAAKAKALDEAKAKFLEGNQSFAEAYQSLRNAPENHSRNYFASDIAHKFDTYGELSDKQVTAFISSVARDLKWKAEKEAEAVSSILIPELKDGKVSMEGEIVSIKMHYSEIWGNSMKMLVKLTDGNKVWGSFPAPLAEAKADKGDKISFIATVTKSDEDEHFGFFKRPSKTKIIEKAQP
jgi:hypothetical protein